MRFDEILTASLVAMKGVLNLEKNQFSGTIAVELGNLVLLTELLLSDNQLSGSIPSQLGNLMHLGM